MAILELEKSYDALEGSLKPKLGKKNQEIAKL